MRVCPSCGYENGDDARFCSQCATSLADGAPQREERKVVTCLFCDLVGFTARAESMDPEDVRRLLQPYHARVRTELERFGGTVEKFIGDAVMAVFGAPLAHEDDPERAVRAALSIRDLLAEEGELDVRIGITTGEALVALGARPEAGEGMASGDVVNTAARLQTAAPTNGILVDETTFRATERAIEYGESHSIEAKGKTEPVPVWEAQKARARVTVERVGGAQLVGREQELRLLRQTLARVVREREPQLVTLVGVPGVGKSRLVYELFQAIETGEHGLVFWRQGRSLPYGDGVTFWAMGEIVKAQAGVLESDMSEQAGDKLQRAVRRFVADDGDAAWIERKLRPLAGLETEESAAGDRRDESFAAWRTYLEAIADERPLVLVFEDLHWADDALLDFVDYLVEWAKGVPLLVLATARPELLSRRAGWGGGKVNAATLQLSPLSEKETATLLHALLGRSAIDADLQTRLLEHAGGNPLYAEEFTRRLRERPTATDVPENVQAMIAARLDTLSPEEKELLQSAAVVGRTFWLGALGHERWRLEDQLHHLERKGFVAVQRRSAVAGESEYLFRHALVRDVAYEQIPRAARSEKHLAAAEWVESLGRTEDHAEMLAHHYGAALDYADAAGEAREVDVERARLAMRIAGDRSSALNAYSSAAAYYRRALQLRRDEDPERPELLYRLAYAQHWSGDEERETTIEEARAALLASGSPERAAELETLLTEIWWLRGDRARGSEHISRAYALVLDRPASAEKALVLSQVSRYRMLAGENEDAIRIGEEARLIAMDLGLDELRAHALDNVGIAKSGLGDRSGLEDVEESIRLALASRSPEAARALNNLGAAMVALGEDLRRAAELVDEAMETGKRLGNVNIANFSTTFRLWLRFRTGAWNEALPEMDDFLASIDAGKTHYHEPQTRTARAAARIARGDVEGALEDVHRAVPPARRAADPQNLVPALSGTARVLVDAARLDEARTVTEEALRNAPAVYAPELAWVAEALDCADDIGRWLDKGLETGWVTAARAVLKKDFLRAAAVYSAIGDRADEARSRQQAAVLLAADGHRAASAEQLRLALAFWRSVAATRYIRECEALLGEASEIPA